MSFKNSLWLPNHIIDDSVSAKRLNTEADQMGYAYNDYEERQTGYLEGVGAKFDLEIIPESDLKGIIEERERKGRTNKALRDYHGLQSLDQNGYPYCWAHGPVQVMQYLQLKSGEKLRLLSAISVAAPVKNFAKVGGWADQAISYMVENGVNEAVDWPINALNRKYFNAENKAKAKLNQVQGWYDLEPKNFLELCTYLVKVGPCAVAFLWWGHLVCAVDPVVVDGEIALLIDNSWSPRWGDNGMSVIRGKKKLADEQMGPVVREATASNTSRLARTVVA